MMRNTLFVALASIALVGCERPTAPKPMANADVSAASSATTFSGQATVVQTTVSPGAISPIGITLGGTGPLPGSGGALNATLLTAAISKDQTAGILALDAEVGHASTLGQGKRSDAQATVANVSLDVAGNAVQATFLQALASAVCDAVSGALASGSSTITDLVINGAPYPVGTAANQVIVDLPALRVVANEQTTSGDATNSDITVNALHVTAYTVNLDGSRGAQVADVIIASAHADIHCSQCTDLGDNFTTGGGWIAAEAPDARKPFAVGGGYKNGVPWGHLTYLDKAAGLKVKGTAVLLYTIAPSDKGGTQSTINGTAELSDGTSVDYTVKTEDNGEPGTADTFDITLSNGYHYGGTLGGGNIQFHGKPSPCS